jgi:hypothetical protein
VKNAYQALALQNLPAGANPKLILNECIVDNAYDAGIISLNSSIRARNCLISNCGRNLYLVQGGNYQFTNCTVVTYASSFIEHKMPVLTLSDFANNSSFALDASFRNCIFWGENGLVKDEVLVEKKGTATFNVSFNNNLWKVETTPTNITSSNIIPNQAPLFDSINTFKNYYSFRLQTGSPAINKGGNFGVGTDLDGKSRPLGAAPDLGCFEKQ